MNKIRIAIVLIVLLIAGIALTAGGVSDIVKLSGDIPDFNYDSMANIKKGDFVQGYVENILDCYANETTTNTTMGIETSSRTSEEYFIMPLLNEADSEKDLYITITASKADDRRLLYDICDETWEYMDGAENIDWTEMGIVAKVKDIDPELMQYMTEWFQAAEYCDGDSAEIQKHIVPYELVVFNTNSAYISLIVGLVILAAFAVAGVIAYRKIRPKTVPSYEENYPSQGIGTAPAQTPKDGFAETYTPSEPVPIPDIPQPVQPDEFFARPVKKAADPEKTAEVKAPAAEEKAPVQAAAYGDMDVLDTSALSMDGLDDPNGGSPEEEYEFTE